MSKEYKAESMRKNSRHINYFNTLDENIKIVKAEKVTTFIYTVIGKKIQ